MVEDRVQKVLIKEVVDNSTLEYCYQKLAEELFELGELVMKQITKPKGANSDERINHLIEEMGDVLLNVQGLAIKLDVENQVDKRIKYKLDQCLNRVKKQKKILSENLSLGIVIEVNDNSFFVNEDEY